MSDSISSRPIIETKFAIRVLIPDFKEFDLVLNYRRLAFKKRHVTHCVELVATLGATVFSSDFWRKNKNSCMNILRHPQPNHALILHVYILMIIPFFDVTPCSLVDRYQHFGEPASCYVVSLVRSGRGKASHFGNSVVCKFNMGYSRLISNGYLDFRPLTGSPNRFPHYTKLRRK
jgi:hypothetical protein